MRWTILQASYRPTFIVMFSWDVPPKPADQLRDGNAVSVSCNYCKRVVPLDLADMVARGLGIGRKSSCRSGAVLAVAAASV